MFRFGGLPILDSYVFGLHVIFHDGGSSIMASPSVKPLCLTCGGRKARFMWGTHDNEAMVFCSLKCATAHAIDHTESMHWCVTHMRWYQDGTRCDLCVAYEERMSGKKPSHSGRAREAV